MIALIWEVYNDRHGDANKWFDVIVRLIVLVCESQLIHLFLHKPFITSLLLSTAIFFLFFDYVITYILIKNGTVEPPRGVRYNWFTYEAKSGIFDTMDWWKYSPWLRLGIKLAYFLVSLILFVKL